MTEIISRKLFTDNNKTETISLSELKRTINAEDIGGLSRTRPVTHFSFIDTLLAEVQTVNPTAEVNNIYIGKSPGTKLIKQVEAQFGEKALDAWLLDRITGKITLLDKNDMDYHPVIAFSYHDKGLEIAYGQNVNDCANLCIFGSNRMFTYGSGKNVDYDKMVTSFKQWCTILPAMAEEDARIINKMREITVTGPDMVKTIGKLLIIANAANMGKRVVAPLNVTQVSDVTRGLLKKDEQMFADHSSCSLWDFYNAMTYVIKPERSDMVTLLEDVNNISNMFVEQFNLN
mgnify:CR=1 FL=1